jgi:hypothetical protein
VQSALHLVVQSAVVGTETQFVVQWSLQHSLHEASQSVDDPEVEHDAVQSPPQRELQSVWQSIDGGLAWHFVEQSDSQVPVHVVSACALHCVLQDASSCTTHACSHAAGAHWVVQFCCVSIVQDALMSILMSPHADTTVVSADASRPNAARATNASEAASEGERTRRTPEREIVFIERGLQQGASHDAVRGEFQRDACFQRARALEMFDRGVAHHLRECHGRGGFE